MSSFVDPAQQAARLQRLSLLDASGSLQALNALRVYLKDELYSTALGAIGEAQIFERLQGFDIGVIRRESHRCRRMKHQLMEAQMASPLRLTDPCSVTTKARENRKTRPRRRRTATPKCCSGLCDRLSTISCRSMSRPCPSPRAD